LRVIGGSAGGLRLVAPRDRGTRPVADRVKETCFAILGLRVEDARVLDLYAGSGALGIEALSRGAAHCVFVERAPAAVAAIRANLQHTGLADRAEVHLETVERYLASLGDAQFNLVFVDPPYAERAILGPLEQILPALARGVVVVKHFWKAVTPVPAGLEVTRERRFGETSLTFLERTGATADDTDQ
jgi:16S rRNA (guanine(966)-N(2))-methyltransferase RsmD